MDATAAYPRWPSAAPVASGLGGALAAGTPDRIPLLPALVNDSSRRERFGGVDCGGVVTLVHRNAPGHSYLRPHKRGRFQSSRNAARMARGEIGFFHRRHREFVPAGIIRGELETAIRADLRATTSAISKWQGNALVGLEIPPPPSSSRTTGTSEHAVFYPTGELLQQVTVYRSSGDPKRRGRGNVVEFGAVVRQLELLGSREGYGPYGTSALRVVARGATNCAVLTADMESDLVPHLRLDCQLRHDEMVHHVAASPHTDSEFAMVLGDGSVRHWQAADGISRMVSSAANAARDHLLQCEYSSHPCVLWTANRSRVTTLDLRAPQPPASTAQALFDLAALHAHHLSEIYAIRRRMRSPFQLIVGSDVSIELLDTRMPRHSLLSWAQRDQVQRDTPFVGILEDVSYGGTSRNDQGLILSNTQGHKTISVYSFDRRVDRSESASASPFLHLAPLRNPSDSMNQNVATQYVAADAPLDIQLRDGGEWTSLLGMCALSNGPRGRRTTVYQLNSLGDLFAQELRPNAVGEGYDNAVQLDLPCGTTAHPRAPDEALDERQELPLPVDAIVREHDADSMTPFFPAPIKSLLRRYPRIDRHAAQVPNNTESNVAEVADVKTDGDDDNGLDADVAEELLKCVQEICRPSATLYRLQRYVNERLQRRITTGALLQLVRGSDEFHVRSVHHRFRQPVTRILGANLSSDLHEAGDDPRLAPCACCPLTSAEPCASLACVVPHALIVSCAAELHVEACVAHQPQAKSHIPISKHYGLILQQARELYGQT